MRKLSRWAVAFVLVASGCGQPEAARQVVDVSPPSDAELKRPIHEALARIVEARERLSTAPEQAAALLGEAEHSLRRVTSYYLPLQEARQLAAEAYGSYSTSDVDSAFEQLDQVESILLRLASAHGGNTARELKEPLEVLEDARLAVAAPSVHGVEPFERLMERLQAMNRKGSFVLSAE